MSRASIQAPIDAVNEWFSDERVIHLPVEGATDEAQRWLASQFIADKLVVARREVLAEVPGSSLVTYVLPALSVPLPDPFEVRVLGEENPFSGVEIKLDQVAMEQRTHDTDELNVVFDGATILSPHKLEGNRVLGEAYDAVKQGGEGLHVVVGSLLGLNDLNEVYGGIGINDGRYVISISEWDSWT